MPSSTDDEDLLEPTQPTSWGDTIKQEPTRRHSSLHDRLPKRQARTSLLLQPLWTNEEADTAPSASPDPHSQASAQSEQFECSEVNRSFETNILSPISTPSKACNLGSHASNDDKFRARFSTEQDFVVNEIVLVPRSTPGLHYGRIMTLDPDKRLATVLLSDTGGLQKLLPFLFIGKLVSSAPLLARTKANQTLDGARDLFDFIYTNSIGAEQDRESGKEQLRLSPGLIRSSAYLLFHHVQLIAQLIPSEEVKVYTSSSESTRISSPCNCKKHSPSYDNDDLQTARSLRGKVMDLLHSVMEMEEKVTNSFIAADK